MDRKTQNMFMLVVIVLLMLAALAGCIEREPLEKEGAPLGGDHSAEQQDLRAYFPALLGMTYQFAGEGNEYASFKRTVKYVDQPYIQVYDDNGGTISVTVYELQDDQISKVFFQGEFYEDENILGKIGKDKVDEEVILKSPIKAGTTWESTEWKREIVDSDVTVTVPAGTFYHAVKVKTTSKRKENTMTSYDYYAQNVGLVFREYKGEGFEVTSKLASYGNPNAKENRMTEETTSSSMVDPAATKSASERSAENLDSSEVVEASDATTVAAMQNPDLPLLAYQLEHQLRAAFRAAYESYVNLKQFPARDQRQFDQVLALYRVDLLTLATGALVDEQVNRLKDYYEAGEEEVSFPSHEVVQAARLLSQTPRNVRVGISVQKFYPEKDWSGRAVDRRGDYIVELTKTGLMWKIVSVEEAD